MSVNVETFRARFPEFEKATDTMVVAALAEAARGCDPGIFGNRFADGVCLKAADQLAISPWGRMARMVSKEGTSTYGARFDALVLVVAGGAWVVQ